MSIESRRAFWVLEHVNSGLFIGRYDRHWTRGHFEGAALYGSEAEASNALQALKQEAADRCAASKDRWPDQMWWDIHGGLTVVRAVEQIMRVVEPSTSEGAF